MFDPEKVRASVRTFVPCCLIHCVFVATSPCGARAGDLSPNVVLIFCDDLGYGDLSCYGATTQRTPNIDLLAAQGTRFTSFYVTSGVCTPSRSSLMTGCYPRRVNMHSGDGDSWVLFPGHAKGLHPDEVTVAEVLGSTGYATGIIGKWHLGDQLEFFPTRQGFDSWFGIPYSNDMGQLPRRRPGRPPTPLVRDETVIESEPDQRLLTRRYTEEAVRFIRENRERPFFLYIPHTFPHWPHYASPEFEGSSRYSLYGDSIQEVDWSTGQIVATLRALGIDRRTLVIFTSDNGARTIENEGSNGPLRAGKGTTWEGGQRVPCVAWWPGTIPAGRTCDTLVSSMDVLPTLARLAGAKLSDDRPIDGHDIRKVLVGEETKSPYEAFYYYYRGDLQCVRSGQWKMRVAVTAHEPRPNGRGRRRVHRAIEPLLYDLDADTGETTDVAAKHPDVVQRLLALVERAREELGDGEQVGKGQRPAGRAENPKPLLPIVKAE